MLKVYKLLFTTLLAVLYLLVSGCRSTRFDFAGIESVALPAQKPFPQNCTFRISKLYLRTIRDTKYIEVHPAALNISLALEHPEYFALAERGYGIPLKVYINVYRGKWWTPLVGLVTYFPCAGTLGLLPCVVPLSHCVIKISPDQDRSSFSYDFDDNSVDITGSGSSKIGLFVGCTKYADVSWLEDNKRITKCHFSNRVFRYIVYLVSRLNREEVNRYYFNLKWDEDKNKEILKETVDVEEVMRY